jgi:hypothetical protein
MGHEGPTGHGIGRAARAYIPNYITHHKERVRIEDDGGCNRGHSQSTEKIIQTDPKSWSIDTADGSLLPALSNCARHSNGVDILT